LPACLLTNAGRFNEYFGVDFDGLKNLIALVLPIVVIPHLMNQFHEL